MHSVFLYHAIKAGMDMGVVNAGGSRCLTPRSGTAEGLRGRRAEPPAGCVQRLLDIANASTAAPISKEGAEYSPGATAIGKTAVARTRAPRYHFVDTDTEEARQQASAPLHVIEGPLMDGINTSATCSAPGKMYSAAGRKVGALMKQAIAT